MLGSKWVRWLRLRSRLRLAATRIIAAHQHLTAPPTHRRDLVVYLSRDNVRPTAERKLTTAKQRNLDTTSTQQVTDAFASAKFHVRVPPAFTRWPTHQTNHVGGEEFAPQSMHIRCRLTQSSTGSTLDHMIELSQQQTIDQLAQRLVGVYPDADPHRCRTARERGMQRI